MARPAKISNRQPPARNPSFLNNHLSLAPAPPSPLHDLSSSLSPSLLSDLPLAPQSSTVCSFLLSLRPLPLPSPAHPSLPSPTSRVSSRPRALEVVSSCPSLACTALPQHIPEQGERREEPGAATGEERRRRRKGRKSTRWSWGGGGRGGGGGGGREEEEGRRRKGGGRAGAGAGAGGAAATFKHQPSPPQQRTVQARPCSPSSSCPPLPWTSTPYPAGAQLTRQGDAPSSHELFLERSLALDLSQLLSALECPAAAQLTWSSHLDILCARFLVGKEVRRRSTQAQPALPQLCCLGPRPPLVLGDADVFDEGLWGKEVSCEERRGGEEGRRGEEERGRGRKEMRKEGRRRRGGERRREAGG
eukprot:748798-Hanusia_phi.AAC.2